MDCDQFIAATERDARIATAVLSALRAMILTTGRDVRISDAFVKLNFNLEIGQLCNVLAILGIDMDDLPPTR